MKLISGFVDTYLRLNAEEEVRLRTQTNSIKSGASNIFGGGILTREERNQFFEPSLLIPNTRCTRLPKLQFLLTYLAKRKL